MGNLEIKKEQNLFEKFELEFINTPGWVDNKVFWECNVKVEIRKPSLISTEITAKDVTYALAKRAKVNRSNNNWDVKEFDPICCLTGRKR